MNILQNGEPLGKSLYTINKSKQTFQSLEDDLELDFTGLNGWTFDILGCAFCSISGGNNCNIIGGNRDNFVFGDNCTFDVGWGCNFITGKGCTIYTKGHYANFDTGDDCTIRSGNKMNNLEKIGNNCTVY